MAQLGFFPRDKAQREVTWVQCRQLEFHCDIPLRVGCTAPTASESDRGDLGAVPPLRHAACGRQNAIWVPWTQLPIQGQRREVRTHEVCSSLTFCALATSIWVWSWRFEHLCTPPRSASAAPRLRTGTTLTGKALKLPLASHSGKGPQEPAWCSTYRTSQGTSASPPLLCLSRPAPAHTSSPRGLWVPRSAPHSTRAHSCGGRGVGRWQQGLVAGQAGLPHSRWDGGGCRRSTMSASWGSTSLSSAVRRASALRFSKAMSPPSSAAAPPRRRRRRPGRGHPNRGPEDAQEGVSASAGTRGPTPPRGLVTRACRALSLRLSHLSALSASLSSLPP